MTYKEYFIKVLKETSREGIDNVIKNLEDLGFFEAPASTLFHLNEPGGLLVHSCNVYRQAMALKRLEVDFCDKLEERSSTHGVRNLASKLPDDSIAIAALLHDISKAEIYKPVKKNRKNAAGKWEEYDGYDVDYSSFPLGHGEKSVIRLLQWGLKMTEDEIIAIRWHMGPWDLAFQSPEQRNNNSAAKDKCPLLSIICAADGLSSSILEAKA